MKGPWIKLWRSFMTDSKIQTLLKRYGDVTVTLLVTLMTVTDDGIIVTPIDEIAVICNRTDQEILDLIDKIIERGILSRQENGILVFNNWEKYQQNESTNRVRKFREKNKESVTETLHERYSNGKCNGNVTVEEEVEVEVDNIHSQEKTKKHKYGNEKNVMLSENRYKELETELGESFLKLCIEELSSYKAYTGKTYKRDDLVIRKWVIDAVKKKQPTNSPTIPATSIVKEKPTCKACGSTDLAPGWCRVCHWDYIQEPKQWLIDNPIEVKS